MLSASYAHVLTLQADGTVKAFGTSSATNVPSNLSNVVAVAAGGVDGKYFGVALKDNGRVVAWGDNNRGQTNAPATLTNVVAIAAGWFHSLALKADGNVVAWGHGIDGSTNVPPGLNQVVAIGVGQVHNRVLRANGTTLAWGDISYTPFGVSNFIAIAVGDTVDVALAANGRITVLTPSGSPAVPSGLTNVVLLASGNAHTLALGENAAPTAFGIVAWTYPNTDLTLSFFPPFDPNNDSISLLVQSVPTAGGALYQHQGGMRGDAIILPGTPITDPSNRVIYAPPPDAINTVYGAFGYAATDGQLTSPTVYATMQIFMPAAPQLSGAKTKLTPGGDFELNFSGQGGATYRVWASTNLVHWSTLGFAMPTSNGWFQFKDFAASSNAYRFYRAGAP
ncbi:MAG: hypothetical protein AAB370_05210 [Verrucomicrobiota bacterium]